MTTEQSHWGSPQRLEFVIKILDIQAEAYISLVDTMESQEQFAILLNEFGNQAFLNQTGYPLDQIAFAASEDEVRVIQKRVSYWVNESYKRLIPTPQPEQKSAEASGGDDTERRERLLAEYKTATGEPSNRSIYEAHNSPIHKPEFYKWLNGDLPADSATTINFERFLHSKKPPIPKNVKD